MSVTGFLRNRQAFVEGFVCRRGMSVAVGIAVREQEEGANTGIASVISGVGGGEKALRGRHRSLARARQGQPQDEASPGVRMGAGALCDQFVAQLDTPLGLARCEIPAANRALEMYLKTKVGQP